MADVVTLNGTINLGPAAANGDGSFPIGVVDIPLSLRPTAKTAPVNSGKITKSFTSGTYATLPGAGDAVTKGTFLYFRTSNDGNVRITTDDGSGGSVVSVIPVSGLLILEFPSLKFLKQLESNIVGQIEYAISGDS